MDKTYISEYEKWISSPSLSCDSRTELEDLRGEDREIRERFSTMLSFGTAGLRGIMRTGLNGMNIHTVRLAAQAVATVINTDPAAQRRRDPSVAIAFDSRNKSELFAKESARVLAANGIRVNIFGSLRPTPELSFALRETGSIAGINITASHNTREYNGFKVYWEDGAQIAPDLAAKIAEVMAAIDIFEDVDIVDYEEALQKGLIVMLGTEMDEKYIAKVLEQSVGSEYVRRAADDLGIVYTPFHGAGYRLVPEVLERIGFKKLVTVDEQMVIDGDFPTVSSPNPEYREGFDIAVALAQKNGIDLIIGTDPDGDRCGIVVRNGDEYRTLTGNQIGVLLLDYLIRARREQQILPDDSVVIKSIVSTTMADRICAQQGVDIENVLTGFKYIGEKIREYEETGERTFLFGFEESNGYLTGTYSRDKDAVLASMLIAEMACFYHLKGMTLAEALNELYETYGQYREKVASFVFEGLEGRERMDRIMKDLRRDPPTSIGLKINRIRDYGSGRITDCEGRDVGDTDLPESDILFYELDSDCSAIIRPSGTEPKIKFYIMARGESAEEAETMLSRIEAAGSSLLA